MSKYDGCPDENCDGCEGTEPYFQNLGKLPKPPPFTRTTEQLRAAMNAAFDKYPNHRLNAVAMISLMSYDMNVQPHEFKEAEHVIADFLASQKHAGVITVTKGRNGGMMRNHVSDNPLLKAVAPLQNASCTPAINDHTCPCCGNTSCSKSERSCWKCGGLL